MGSPDRQLSGPPNHPLDEAVGDLAHHVGALDSRAGLPRVREAAPHAARDRVLQVGIAADDLRVLAAQLQHGSLELPGADLADPATHLHRAGEEDLPHRGFAERLTDRAAAVDDPHQPLRQARLLERLADPLSEQRRQAGRLQHDPVAGQERHGDLVEGDRPRVVPRRDHPHDPERLVAELRLLRQEQRLAHANRLVVEDLWAGVRAPVKDVDRGNDLHRVALRDRLPLLAGEQLSDLLELLDQDVGRAAQVAGAVGERQLGPEGLHLGDVVDDRLHLRGLNGLDRADQLAGGGVEGLELPHGRIYGDRAGGPARPIAGPPCSARRGGWSTAAFDSAWLSGWR